MKVYIKNLFSFIMKPLYFAPINFYGNYIYRHILLENGADFVFSELIRIDDIDNSIRNNKLDIIRQDIKRTIFQIGASSVLQVKTGVQLLKNKFGDVKEINLNMGCPHSSMKDRKICGGILYDKGLMQALSEELSKECSKYGIIPSVKLRLGTNENNIEIQDYLDILEKAGIMKVYIHTRPLCYPYTKPANYEPISQIKTNVEIILNGDIDCYGLYEQIANKYKCSGIMVGRAALSNPLVFKQIKNKVKTDPIGFDPIKNDPTIVKCADKFFMSEQKSDIILNYLDLAQEQNARHELVKMNISYLIKGASGANNLLKKMNKHKTIIKIKKEFVKFIQISPLQKGY